MSFSPLPKGSKLRSGLLHLDSAHSTRRTLPALDAWQVDISGHPTLYERIMYGREQVNETRCKVTTTVVTKRASQVKPGQYRNDAASEKIEMDLLFVGAWVDNGDASYSGKITLVIASISFCPDANT